MAGIAGGAEAIVVPEADSDPAVVAEELRAAYARGKSHAIAVISEGAQYDAEALMRYFHAHRDRLGFELRLTKLGHVQRGGATGGCGTFGSRADLGDVKPGAVPWRSLGEGGGDVG